MQETHSGLFYLLVEWVQVLCKCEKLMKLQTKIAPGAGFFAKYTLSVFFPHQKICCPKPIPSFYNCSKEEPQSENSFFSTLGSYEVSRYRVFPDEQIMSNVIISSLILIFQPVVENFCSHSKNSKLYFNELCCQQENGQCSFYRAPSQGVGRDCVGQPEARALSC